MARNAQERPNAIMPAIGRRDDFLIRLKNAYDERTVTDLMAEAIDMHIEANGLELVRRDGRAMVSMEEICASHCLKAARETYALLRRSGSTP
jgi:hypothetical protein